MYVWSYGGPWCRKGKCYVVGTGYYSHDRFGQEEVHAVSLRVARSSGGSLRHRGPRLAAATTRASVSLVWHSVPVDSIILVVWPTTSCFADWSKHRHVTLRIIDCQEVVLTCYRIFITCHGRPLDMSKNVTRLGLDICCKYSTSCSVTSSIPARSLNQT